MKLAECTNEHLIHGQIYLMNQKIWEQIDIQIYFRMNFNVNITINNKLAWVINQQIFNQLAGY